MTDREAHKRIARMNKLNADLWDVDDHTLKEHVFAIVKVQVGTLFNGKPYAAVYIGNVQAESCTNIRQQAIGSAFGKAFVMKEKQK